MRIKRKSSGSVPIKTADDLAWVMNQERGKAYLAVNGNLFMVDDNCLFEENDAAEYWISVCKTLKEDMDASKNTHQYDTIINELSRTYVMKFRIH